MGAPISDPGKGYYDIPGTYSPDGTQIVFAEESGYSNIVSDVQIPLP